MHVVEANRYPHVKTRRMQELEAMIAMGWGSVSPQRLIPSNWWETAGPYLSDEEDEQDGEGREARKATA